ncbi:hypothetical protein G6F26_007154 [Rhizopus arrhizus]|nr:hypothetical protein G6F33_009861 [Rhizopus arrhizus]KAG0960455.1 hypothetical protein G6F31_010637 [Rhizopus arrhizus]KAG1023032.1 hypothetical protein G6F26_007154 [Rhizopus arrhizus]
MMISSDSLFDNETVVNAPTTSSENDPSPSEFFISNNADNITGHQETNTNLPSENQKEKDDDDDSDQFITPTNEEGENILSDIPEEKIASNEISKKEENNAYIQRTLTENELYCVQTAINSRYIDLDDTLDQIRYNIEHGAYYSATSAQEPPKVNKEKMPVDGSAQEDANQASVTRPIEKPLPDQPHSDKPFPSVNRSQALSASDNTSQQMPSSANTSQFYSTPSTPKAARPSKRKSILSINMKKKNCIIL